MCICLFKNKVSFNLKILFLFDDLECILCGYLLPLIYNLTYVLNQFILN